MIDLKSVVGGAIVSAAISVGLITGLAPSDTSAPQNLPPSAPALESGQSVAYFCKADLLEIIDNTQPGSIPSATDFGRTKILHTCKAPDGTIVRLDATGKFIEAKDAKGLPMTEAQAKEYLR